MAVVLSDKEAMVLKALRRKGPALAFELAARTLSFPDELAEPIRALAEMGLVEIEPVATGRIGGEMVAINAKGIDQLDRQEG